MSRWEPYSARTGNKGIWGESAPARGAIRYRSLVCRPNMVSIHAPARGATQWRSGANRFRCVSIHAPARGATAYPRQGFQRGMCFDPCPARGATRSERISPGCGRFDPRPRAGGNLCPVPGSRHGKGFDPRPRAGGRLFNEIAPVLMKAFRSTPPRGGDERHVLWKVAKGVSIHAPARGATGPARELSARIDVSIHARAGGDLAQDVWREAGRVSIHAPRGGRRHGANTPRRGNCFDPRPRAGGDLLFLKRLRLHQGFRSTPPRGGRHGELPQAVNCHHVSIHAPARGATTETQTPDQRRKTFRSTPPRGGRLGAYQMHTEALTFRSTPPRGGRPVPRRAVEGPRRVSIHAPARGATYHPDLPRPSSDVSIHAPRGGRHAFVVMV